MARSRLPQDTRALFTEAEVRAEKTVAVLRMVIAAALGLVFALAIPSLTPGELSTAMLIRQWLFASGTLLAYLLLGLASYRAISRGLYRPWMAWLVVTGDCAFIAAGLFLGLRNTGLAPEHLVALPPVWLVPVVLAFGALRFNPMLQGYLIGLLGAAVLAVYLLTSQPVDPAPPEVLELFFELPPNLMRLAMVLLAGIILVVAATHARALLARAIGESQRRANLTRYLPRQIAESMADAGMDALQRGRRQNAAVMFVDIRNFTAMSEGLPPEETGAFLSDFRGRMIAAADASGGIVDKFIGDAAMIVFGLAEPSDRDAAAALDCANDILARIEAWNREREEKGRDPIGVGIGVHWGGLFAGAIGNEARLEYTVLGDTVNVAARLEELTKEVHLPLCASRDILEAAGPGVRWDDWKQVDSVTLRGRKAPLEIFGSQGPGVAG